MNMRIQVLKLVVKSANSLPAMGSFRVSARLGALELLLRR
jgi:hypothetical protein